MSDNNQLIHYGDNSLLDVFCTSEDELGMDLLKMSDFFEILIEKSREKINCSYKWDNVVDIHSISGQIASAIKGGIDISKMGVLVADQSHFSKDIVDGLKSGIYHIGESKEVSGNFRPAIVDDNNTLVKFFTLKKAFDPTAVLSDISMFSMQSTLNNISLELKHISSQINYSINLARRTYLSNPFINARENVKKAFNNPELKDGFLIEADKYLTEGLTSLYTDLKNEIEYLSTYASIIRGKIECVDELLFHINEDMLMIPKYVAVQIYLLNYSGRYADAQNVIKTYKHQIEKMEQGKIYFKGRFSAVEVIHEMYHYNEYNRDFWLDMPANTVKALEPLERMIEQKGTEVIFIDANTPEYIGVKGGM